MGNVMRCRRRRECVVRMANASTTLGGEIPGQERLNVFGRLSAGRCTTLQVPRQPPSRIEFPVGQRGQQRKHRRCQPATPQGTRAVEVLPRHGRAASRSFRSVVVHRNAWIIDEPNESRPVLLRGFPEPCGTAGGVWDRKVLPPLRHASPPPPDATRHLALETSRSRADGADAPD